MQYPDYKPYTIKWISDDGEVENRLIDGCAWDSIIEMAEKEAKGRSVEIWTRPRYDERKADPLIEELCYSRLSLKRRMELDGIMSDMVDEAKSMVDDYVKNPSSLSGSMDVEAGKVKGDGYLIHENSPLLKEKKSESSKVIYTDSKKIEVRTYEEELDAVKSKYEIDANGMVRLDESGNPIEASGKDED